MNNILYNCERCGKDVFEKFGSGRFCSKKCANSHIVTEEQKEKISKALRKYDGPRILPKTSKLPKNIKCSICNKYFSIRGINRHMTCLHKDDDRYKYLKEYIGNGISLDITKEELKQYRINHTNCEICGKSVQKILNEDNHFKELCRDHDHTTNKFRGLLCVTCNRALGWYENQKENIEKYLNKKML